MSSLAEFRDFIASCGLDFNSLSKSELFEWRGLFEKRAKNDGDLRLEVNDLKYSFANFKVSTREMDFKAAIPHVPGITTEAMWLQHLKSTNQLTSNDSEFSRFLSEIKVTWWISASIGKFPSYRANETDDCQPFVRDMIEKFTACGGNVFREPRKSPIFFRSPPKINIKLVSEPVDCHSTVSYGRRKPDIVCYAGAKRGAMSITIVGDVKGCTSVNNSFPDSERGHILDMTKDLLLLEQPSRIFCYCFLTDGNRFQFFKVTRMKPRTHSELSYQESAVYCGVLGWQIFFGLLSASLSSVGFTLPLIDDVTISSALGSGRFCNVYVASQTGSGNRDVALKVYDSENAYVADAERKTLTVLAGCSHVPNIVEWREQTVSGYCVLAVLPIGLKVLPCAFPTALSGTQYCALLAAVKYAHEKGIVHRDIKPDNIYLDQENKSRIILNDWGSSAALGVKCKWVGTLAYCPDRPDEDGDHIPTIQSDLISLVRTVYVIHKQVYPRMEDGATTCEPFWEMIKTSSNSFATMLNHATSEAYNELEKLLAAQM